MSLRCGWNRCTDVAVKRFHDAPDPAGPAPFTPGNLDLCPRHARPIVEAPDRNRRAA